MSPCHRIIKTSEKSAPYLLNIFIYLITLQKLHAWLLSCTGFAMEKSHTFWWPNDAFVMYQVNVLYLLSWERSRVGRLLTACLRQSELIISLMIWALDMCPGQMRAGKCTHGAVCINLPFQLGLRGNRGREEVGGIIGLRCVWLAVPLAPRVREFREKQIIALPQVKPS